MRLRMELSTEYASPETADRASRPVLDVIYLLGGIAVIVVGADLLVDGAATAARSLGVSDAIVGLTIVAIGTSAPEFVTTLLLRGELRHCSWQPARVERVQPGAHPRTHDSVRSDRG